MCSVPSACAACGWLPCHWLQVRHVCSYVLSVSCGQLGPCTMAAAMGGRTPGTCWCPALWSDWSCRFKEWLILLPRAAQGDQCIWHIIRWHQASYLCLLGVCLADAAAAGPAAGALPCTLVRSAKLLVSLAVATYDARSTRCCKSKGVDQYQSMDTACRVSLLQHSAAFDIWASMQPWMQHELLASI